MQDSGITVVLGASPKEERYSNRAMKMLEEKGFEFEGIANRTFEFNGHKIATDISKADWRQKNIQTITLYLSAKNQEVWKEWILNSNTQRVIFNPGTENEEFERELQNTGILALRACTLVLLSTNQY